MNKSTRKRQPGKGRKVRKVRKLSPRRARQRSDQVRCPDCKNTRRVRDDLKKLTVAVRKKFLGQLAVNTGVTTAAGMVGVTRQAIYKLIESDPEFAEQVKDAKERVLDTAQITVNRNVLNGDQRAAEYVLDNLGKERGFGRTKDISVALIKAQAAEDVRSVIDLTAAAIRKYVKDENARDQIRTAILEGIPGDTDGRFRPADA